MWRSSCVTPRRERVECGAALTLTADEGNDRCHQQGQHRKQRIQVHIDSGGQGMNRQQRRKGGAVNEDKERAASELSLRERSSGGMSRQRQRQWLPLHTAHRSGTHQRLTTRSTHSNVRTAHYRARCREVSEASTADGVRLGDEAADGRAGSIDRSIEFNSYPLPTRHCAVLHRTLHSTQHSASAPPLRTLVFEPHPRLVPKLGACHC